MAHTRRGLLRGLSEQHSTSDSLSPPPPTAKVRLLDDVTGGRVGTRSGILVSVLLLLLLLRQHPNFCGSLAFTRQFAVSPQLAIGAADCQIH